MGIERKMNGEQKELARLFVHKLPLLRASLRITQADVAKAIGVSRMTYVSIETGKRLTAWRNFITLFLFFSANEESLNIIRAMGDFEAKVQKYIQMPKAET